MSARSRSTHQSTPWVFILLSIFIFIFISILFKTSQYLISSSSQILSLTSRSTTTHTILKNTEDEQTSIDDLSIYCLQMGSRLDNEQYLPQSPVLHAPSVNSTRLHRLPYRYSQWKSSPLIPRRITPCEHTLIMRLLMIIERMCRKHEITFMMSDGTLLGSWRHHDIIPWDDDADLMIPIEQKSRFSDAINQLSETLVDKQLMSYSQGERQFYKIFFKHTPSVGNYGFNFPSLDVFFYISNTTHLWQMGYPETIMRVEYIFPLVMRPLGELWLPAPLYPDRIFGFDPFDQCKSHNWSHRNETDQEVISLSCDDLKHIHPFVQRYDQTNSTEILRINDIIIHTIIYK